MAPRRSPRTSPRKRTPVQFKTKDGMVSFRANLPTEVKDAKDLERRLAGLPKKMKDNARECWQAGKFACKKSRSRKRKTPERLITTIEGGSPKRPKRSRR